MKDVSDHIDFFEKVTPVNEKLINQQKTYGKQYKNLSKFAPEPDTEMNVLEPHLQHSTYG